MKRIIGVRSAPQPHWVGDGFPVRSLFTYDDDPALFSPFLLLDHAAPTEFKPSSRPRGVGEHPHRGFETVTIVYQGEVEHRDSSGGGGVIGPGDVQWMTAASGVVHDEFHSKAFAQRGGTIEMVQLWVNLPAEHKMSPPTYQAILAADIPSITLPEGAGEVRVIAGEYQGRQGPARTFTPMNVWDVRLSAGRTAEFNVPEGHTLAVITLQGTVSVNDGQIVRAAQVVMFDRAGEHFRVEANAEARFLVLGGAPIEEPVVGYGPFVMNSEAEIRQAIADFNGGRFGRLRPAAVDRPADRSAKTEIVA
jgi:redox-sensitive bicupin YhaK (pirin superfamily)